MLTKDYDMNNKFFLKMMSSEYNVVLHTFNAI